VRWFFRYIFSSKKNISAFGGRQTNYATHGRCLACAISAEKAEYFAFFNLKRDIKQTLAKAVKCIDIFDFH
jgi:hypothetical protein